MQLGYMIARASNWATIPDPETLMNLDPLWLEDLFQTDHLVHFQTASNPVLDMAGKALKKVGGWFGLAKEKGPDRS